MIRMGPGVQHSILIYAIAEFGDCFFRPLIPNLKPRVKVSEVGV